ncbi:MAG TPA: hypothetical protein ENN23_09060 [Deltaproteobacteria bacterium]|nr:hypothetical protein [Deltaproteobacteria bacterium]
MKDAKFIAGVILIFILGASCGALGVHITYKIQVAKYMSGDKSAYQTIIVKHLNRKLSLDAVQREKITDIIEEAQLETQKIREEVWPKVEIVLGTSRLRIKEVLRPDQVEKYNNLIKKHKARSGKTSSTQ